MASQVAKRPKIAAQVAEAAGETMTKLSALLKPKPGTVKMPAYDRTKVTAGILHVGVGNFHRAHMATYMDDYFGANAAAGSDDQEQSKKNTWGIIGAGILSFDHDKREMLQSQDWMQTIVQQNADSVSARVIGSMIDFLPVDYKDQQHQELQKMLLEPKIKIVSMTVTEGGYFLSDSALDMDNPLIQHDMKNPEAPKTIFGLMIKALGKRKEAGIPPFTILSCDNIPHNGNIAKSVTVGLAKLMRPDLAPWIEDTIDFPNSMVDRITPGTTDEQRAYVKDNYEYEDACPVFCEPFRQWVLEDKFKSGRPQLETLENVLFVPDVGPYEFMKIRILNGGHASLCYPSALLGIQYVHKAMEHPVIAKFLDALERNEIVPTVPPVPDTDLTEYWTLIAKRFANPTLNDTIGRNCYDGASRQPKFTIPVIADNLKANRSFDGLALVSAMWCRYCQGVTEAGETIKPNDPQWDRLHTNALKAGDDPKAWLGMKDVYGAVGQDPAVVKAFSSALKSIQEHGVEQAMKNYIASSAASAD